VIPGIEIRSMRGDDPAALVHLFETVLPGFAATATNDGPKRFLDDPTMFALGAYANEVPAGLAWGLQIHYPSGRVVTYLHELDVRAEFRRRGIATQLVTRAMQLARERGSTRFWLSTGGHNEGAQALYEALGGERKPLGDVNYWWALDRG
jgi:ribosomal protein S18 acetylase RimI-like enzyme